MGLIPCLGLGLGLVLILSLAMVRDAAAQVHRCTIDGTVTFQRDPCPTGAPRRPTTAADLNSLRPAASASGPDRTGNWQAKDRVTTPAPEAAPSAGPAAVSGAKAQAGGFRCDGRTYCSQMTSCQEAKFFLANCPGVKMDGNRDGNPCQAQWCGR